MSPSEHSPASLAVAHTPAPWKALSTGSKGGRRVCASMQAAGYHNGEAEILIAEVFGGVLPGEGSFGPWSQPAGDERSGAEKEANAALICAAPDLLAACEAAAGLLTRSGGTLDLEEAYAVRNRLDAAVARARGLRPCDDPSLVPEVLQAQPQCVHGEAWRVTDPETMRCPKHGLLLRTERHEGRTGERCWYTYVCDGFLEEQAKCINGSHVTASSTVECPVHRGALVTTVPDNGVPGLRLHRYICHGESA